MINLKNNLEASIYNQILIILFLFKNARVAGGEGAS